MDTFYHTTPAALGAPYNFIVSSCNNTGKWNNNVKLALIKMKGVCLSLLFVLSQGSLLSCAEQSEECFQSRRQPPLKPPLQGSPTLAWPFPLPTSTTLPSYMIHMAKGMRKEVRSADFFLRATGKESKLLSSSGRPGGRG